MIPVLCSEVKCQVTNVTNVRLFSSRMVLKQVRRVWWWWYTGPHHRVRAGWLNKLSQLKVMMTINMVKVKVSCKSQQKKNLFYFDFDNLRLCTIML